MVATKHAQIGPEGCACQLCSGLYAFMPWYPLWTWILFSACYGLGMLFSACLTITYLYDYAGNRQSLSFVPKRPSSSYERVEAPPVAAVCPTPASSSAPALTNGVVVTFSKYANGVALRKRGVKCEATEARGFGNTKRCLICKHPIK